MHLLSRISLLALLAAIILLPGCFEDEDNPVAYENHLYEIELYADTLYATPGDSARFDFFFRVYDYDRTYALQFDYGDGTGELLEYTHNEILPFTHLYRSKGTYHMRVDGMVDGGEVSPDTAVVIVQDYVRPSQATTIKVTITGLEIVSYNVHQRPGLPDSIALTTSRDFTFETRQWNPDGKLRPLPWENRQSFDRFLSWYDQSIVLPSRRSISGSVTLDPDGKRLRALHLRYDENLKDTDSVRFNYRSVELYDIPLLTGSKPSAEHAVYAVTIPVNPQNKYHCGVYEELQVDSDTEYASRRSIHVSPYSDVTITVEFTQ